MLEITLRSIQHYLYCKHRWGLIEVNKSWSENYFVTKSNIIHERVHNPKMNYNTNDKKRYTGVHVYNDTEPYNLYGVVDCLEFSKESPKEICIVEYKPTKPKNAEYNKADLMQIFAQKVCVDFVFDCDCKAEIYYADTKKRIQLPLSQNYEEYDEELRYILKEMRELLLNGIIPDIDKKQCCNGCSMKDLCMPTFRKVTNIKNKILMSVLDNDGEY